PRPFIFRPPANSKSRYERGDVFEFELLLFGRAQRYFPYFMVAFRELAARGFGVGRGRCRLKSVTALGADDSATEVYSDETQSVRPVVPSIHANEIMKHAVASEQTIRIEFLTPTHLKYQGTVIETPQFHHLIK